MPSQERESVWPHHSKELKIFELVRISIPRIRIGINGNLFRNPPCLTLSLGVELHDLASRFAKRGWSEPVMAPVYFLLIPENQPGLSFPFSPQELEIALNKCKCRSAPDLDGITVKMLITRIRLRCCPTSLKHGRRSCSSNISGTPILYQRSDGLRGLFICASVESPPKTWQLPPFVSYVARS